MKKKVNVFPCTDKNVHKVWHEFCVYMKKWYFGYNYGCIVRKRKIIKGKRKYKYANFNNISGYLAQERVKRFASKHKEVKIIHVDDSTFSSSILALIPHPKMGITALFIPQCTEVTGEFFLYPEATKELLIELQKMDKKCKRKE